MSLESQVGVRLWNLPFFRKAPEAAGVVGEGATLRRAGLEKRSSPFSAFLMAKAEQDGEGPG